MKKALIVGGALLAIYGVLFYFSTESDEYQARAKVADVVLTPSEVEVLPPATTTADLTVVPLSEHATSAPAVSPAQNAVTPSAGDKKLEIIAPTPVSRFPIVAGFLGDGWKTNSWGLLDVADTKQKRDVQVSYTYPWSAYSLYSSSFDLSTFKSVVIEITSSPEDVSHLYLTFFNAKERVGGTPLANYARGQASPARKLLIPLRDLKLTGTSITDFLIESDAVATAHLVSITFSEEEASSLVLPPVEAITEAKSEVTEIPSTTVAPTPPTISPEIYFTGLKNGWTVRTRNTDVELNNEERSVTGVAMKVRFNTTSGALSLLHPSGMAIKGYSTLNIFVFGGVTDHEWQQLYVTLYDINGKKLGTKEISEFSSPQRLQMQVWKNYQIPLWAYDISENTLVSTIDIENASVTQDGDYLWIDNVHLEI